ITNSYIEKNNMKTIFKILSYKTILRSQVIISMEEKSITPYKKIPAQSNGNLKQIIKPADSAILNLIAASSDKDKSKLLDKFQNIQMKRTEKSTESITSTESTTS